MRHAAVVMGLTLALAVPFAAHAQKASPQVTAAVAAADRPDADKARDAARKPADMMTFAEVKPGQKVAELIPGGGYFTRIFSSVVGDSGKVYAVAFGEGGPVKAMAATPGHGNIVVVPFSGNFTVPEPVDLVWTSQNYHDVYGRDPAAATALNAAAFKALKPGGIYIVLDHAGLPGADNKTFHRMDPAVVKEQVLAAGFQYVGDSKAVANPADPHNTNVHDPAIKGNTDQFVLKFRKPK